MSPQKLWLKDSHWACDSRLSRPCSPRHMASCRSAGHSCWWAGSLPHTPRPPCSVTLPPGAARAGRHSSGKREGGEGEAPGSGHSTISSAFYWAEQLVEPVQCRAGEQGCVCPEELRPQCRWRGDRAASTGAVGATHPHAHRGQVSWAVSWAPTASSWSCLFKEPLDIQLLSVPFGAPAYFLPSSGRCFQPFLPSSDLRGVSGRSHRSL